MSRFAESESSRRVGIHVSVAGGVERAVDRGAELDCTAIQIFSHNPRGWAVPPLRPERVRAFREGCETRGLRPYIHASYLVQLASENAPLFERSVEMLKVELDRADALGVEYVIVHPGRAAAVPADRARQRVLQGLRALRRLGVWRARLLMENTAGRAGEFSADLAELGRLWQESPKEVTGGICIDSCHAFVSGIDFRTPEAMATLAGDLDAHFGADVLRVLHVNDAKKSLGSGVDRHAHLGEGEIGEAGLRFFLQHPLLSDLPVLLETPKESEEDDRRNLGVLRRLLQEEPEEV